MAPHHSLGSDPTALRPPPQPPSPAQARRSCSPEVGWRRVKTCALYLRGVAGDTFLPRRQRELKRSWLTMETSVRLGFSKGWLTASCPSLNREDGREEGVAVGGVPALPLWVEWTLGNGAGLEQSCCPHPSGQPTGQGDPRNKGLQGRVRGLGKRFSTTGKGAWRGPAVALPRSSRRHLPEGLGGQPPLRGHLPEGLGGQPPLRGHLPEMQPQPAKSSDSSR